MAMARPTLPTCVPSVASGHKLIVCLLVCLGLGGGNKQSPHHHSPKKMDGTLEARSHSEDPEVSRSTT